MNRSRLFQICLSLMVTVIAMAKKVTRKFTKILLTQMKKNQRDLQGSKDKPKLPFRERVKLSKISDRLSEMRPLMKMRLLTSLKKH